MVRRLAISVLCLAILASPSLADGIGGFAATAATYGFPQGNPPPLTAGTIGPVAVGGLPVLLGKTTITEITAQFGGAIEAAEGDAGTAAAFACYDLGDRTLWFRAGAGEAEAIDMIAIKNGAAEIAWGCSAAPEALDTISFGVPGLGAPVEAVKAGLGESLADADGQFGYVSEHPSDTAPGQFVVQTLLYRVSNGTVNALAVMQKTY